MSGELWSMITILGPVVFGIVLLWVLLNNRRTAGEKARTEAATKANYVEEDKQTKAHNLD